MEDFADLETQRQLAAVESDSSKEDDSSDHLSQLSASDSYSNDDDSSSVVTLERLIAEQANLDRLEALMNGEDDNEDDGDFDDDDDSVYEDFGATGNEGVSCDECGGASLTGTVYHSTRIIDYDICQECYDENHKFLCLADAFVERKGHEHEEDYFENPRSMRMDAFGWTHLLSVVDLDHDNNPRLQNLDANLDPYFFVEPRNLRGFALEADSAREKLKHCMAARDTLKVVYAELPLQNQEHHQPAIASFLQGISASQTIVTLCLTLDFTWQPTIHELCQLIRTNKSIRFLFLKHNSFRMEASEELDVRDPGIEEEEEAQARASAVLLFEALAEGTSLHSFVCEGIRNLNCSDAAIRALRNRPSLKRIKANFVETDDDNNNNTLRELMQAKKHNWMRGWNDLDATANDRVEILEELLRSKQVEPQDQVAALYHFVRSNPGSLPELQEEVVAVDTPRVAKDESKDEIDQTVDLSIPLNPTFLSKEIVVSIHAEHIAKHGGTPGLRDEGLLDSALAQPEASFFGEYLHKSIFEMAAAYLSHIVNNHAFVDGNKRTGLAATLQFLDLNGYIITSEGTELEYLVLEMLEEHKDKVWVSNQLCERATRKEQQQHEVVHADTPNSPDDPQDPNPAFLSKETVVSIHAEQIAKHGGAPGLRDEGLLDSALAQPEASFFGEYLHKTVFEMAAAYIFHIVNNHAFVDGNKRTGLAAALQFLDLNGYHLSSNGTELQELVLEMLQQNMDKAWVANRLRERATRTHVAA